MEGPDQGSQTETRKRLEASARLFQFICEQFPIITWTTDDQLRFTSSAGAGIAGLDYRHEDVIGISLFEHFRTTDPAFPPIAASLRALGGDTVRVEFHWLDREFVIVAGPNADSDEKVTGTVAVALDITDQKAAEDGLREAEDRYDDLMETVREIVYTYDLTGRLTSINAAGEQLLGYTREEICEFCTADIAAPDCRDLPIHMAHFQLRNHAPLTYDMRLLSKTGERLTVEVTTSILKDADGIPMAVQAVARDLSSRQQLYEHLRRSQSLTATGVLAARYAEHYERLAEAILGNAYLLKARVRDRGTSNEAVQGIVESAEDAIRVNQALTAFTAQESSRRTNVDLQGLVKKIGSVLSATLDSRIRLSWDFGFEPVEISGHAAELEQMLLYLALRSAEAMPEGGELQLATEFQDDQITLVLRHSGRLIAQPIGEHGFEPFVAGIIPHDANGIGMAMVATIMQNHGGSIRVEHEGRHCTAFRIELPLLRPALQSAERQRTTDRRHSRGPTVLVINEEAPVRRVLSRMLENLGFRIVASCDRDQAREMYSRNHAPADVILIDLDGSQSRGFEYLEELRQLNPAIRAVVAVRDGADPVGKQAPGGSRVVSKPYSMQVLADTMRAAFTETSGA